MTVAAPGTLHGVGIGPGDPELLTLKALRIIRAAPVIVWPATAGGSLARRIVAPHLPAAPRQQIDIELPLRADKATAARIYDAAAQRIAAQLRAGWDVAAPCLGDPLLYGSFAYLMARLAADYPVQVTPGVCAPAAAAAAVRRPIALGGQVFTVLPAQLCDAQLESRLLQADAAAIIKPGRHIDRLRSLLARLGLMARAVHVRNAAMSDQRITPLAELPPGETSYFSLILIPGAS